MGLSAGLSQAGQAIQRALAGLQENRTQVQDHEIVYLEGGSGDDLLLIHSFGGDKEQWLPFVRQLSRKFRVVIPDLPGFGASQKVSHARYDSVTQVRRLRALVQKLVLKKPHLAGCGMGATLAGLYASAASTGVRSLLLMEPWGIEVADKSEMDRLMERGHQPLVVRTEQEYERVLKMQLLRPSRGEQERQRAARAAADRPLHEKIWDQLWKDKPYLLGSVLGEIKVPALALWGDSNQVVHRTALRRLELGLAGVQSEVFKDCGHLVMVERPKEAAARYVKFVAALT